MTDLLNSEDNLTDFLMGILPAKYNKQYREYMAQKPEEAAAQRERLEKATGTYTPSTE